MKTRVVLLLLAVLSLPSGFAFAGDSITCWFPPSWSAKTAQAQAITTALSEKSGLVIQAQVAKSYPEILSAFDSEKQNLVYVGSFVQSIIAARKLGTPLVQNVNGKELYAGIMIYPESQKPFELLKTNPAEIAYAIGASSGESCAKAATGGKAAVAVSSHLAAVNAVKAGKAKAAFVKNWWWAAHKDEFPGLKSTEIPGVSLQKNPDNVLTASRAVPARVATKIQSAAMASSGAFGQNSVVTPFEPSKVAFSLGLMQKGGIDPLTYSW